jgi:hypothetical protein
MISALIRSASVVELVRELAAGLGHVGGCDDGIDRYYGRLSIASSGTYRLELVKM